MPVRLTAVLARQFLGGGKRLKQIYMQYICQISRSGNTNLSKAVFLSSYKKLNEMHSFRISMDTNISDTYQLFMYIRRIVKIFLFTS